jgi:glycosyltransferase involved in cell wall biosynthesis
MKLTLIITTFNWPESLLLVLDSIRHQTLIPDEVIIADDGSDEKTKSLITDYKKKFNLNIIHSWQENIGFRVSRSRNKAIFKSSGEYIIMIDGDTILHPNFVNDHLISAEPGYFVQGSRVLLSEKLTKKVLVDKIMNFSIFSSQIKNRMNLIHSKVLSSIFSNKKNHLLGIKSCNMAFYRKDCIDINGFNNDFEGWGREDSEFVVRLMNIKINRKNIRFRAIQFHLWHYENSRISLKKNEEILNNTINEKIKCCENGINSIKK